MYFLLAVHKRGYMDWDMYGKYKEIIRDGSTTHGSRQDCSTYFLFYVIGAAVRFV